MGGRSSILRTLSSRPLALLIAVILASLVGTGVAGASRDPAEPYAGFTRMGTTADYVVMVNVLPAERMFTEAENARLHPTVGELIIRGTAGPLGPRARHVEAHLYSRSTGEVVTDVVPTMEIIDHATGKVTGVDATLMQDVVIGEPDQHFGTNVTVAPRHAITVIVRIGDQEVTVDGKLR
jgi:hypothetical protein